MATDDDDRDGALDEPPAGAPAPGARKKTAKKVARKKTARKKTAKKRNPGSPSAAGSTPGAAAGPGNTTTPSTEATPMAEEHVPPPADSTVPAMPLLAPGHVADASGPGAAVATWGPLALLALLIVVFRVGGDDGAANAAPGPRGGSGEAIERSMPRGPASAEGLSLPPLALPGSERLIEELSASPWSLEPQRASPRAEEGSARSTERAAPPAAASDAPAESPRTGPMGPGMPYDGGPRGMQDPASGYWSGYGSGFGGGQPPMGYRGYPPPAPYGQPYGAAPPVDPYWWTQGSLAPPPPPGPQAPRE